MLEPGGRVKCYLAALRRVRPGWPAAIALFAIALLPLAPLAAQGPAGIPPGGGVRPHWKLPAPRASADSSSGWQTRDTLHFRLHLPAGPPDPEQERLFAAAAQISERAYARLSRLLQHRMPAAIPVFLYPSPQDFQAANLFVRGPGESVGGFTDFARRRVVVPFTGDYRALRHVLTHEIVHAFQLSVLPPQLHGQAPLWFMEGMAEWLSRGERGLDGNAEAYLRDLVLHNRAPGLRQLLRLGPAAGYANYAVGYAALRMLASPRYNQSAGQSGMERVAFLLREYAATGDLARALQTATGRTLAELDIDFAADLNHRYRAGFAAQLTRRDARARIASWRHGRAGAFGTSSIDQRGVHLAPTLSPDGRRLAALSVEGPFPVVVIRPAPGPGVSRSQASEIRVLLRGLRSAHFEVWQPGSNRLSWSADGRYILLAARSHGRAALLWIDVAAGRIAAELVPFVETQSGSAAADVAAFAQIQSPVVLPAANGQTRIAFVGLRGDRTDVFVLNADANMLTAGRFLGGLRGPRSLELPLDAGQQLTDDTCFERDLQAGPGGWLYFSASCENQAGAHIFRVPLFGVPGSEPGRTTRGKAVPEQLTALPGSARHPAVGVAGDLIFTSDWSGVRNLYRLPAARLAGPGEPLGDPAELIALSNSATGVAHADVRVLAPTARSGRESVPRADREPVAPGEYIAFSEREEGALAIKVLPPGVRAAGQSDAAPLPAAEQARVQPAASRPQAQGKLDGPQFAFGLDSAGPDSDTISDVDALELREPKAYRPAFAFSGAPFLLIAGGKSRSDARDGGSNGNSRSGSSSGDDDPVRIAALVGAELADDTGDHQIFLLGGYGEAPAQWTGDLRYSFLGWRTDVFIGGFRQSGGFPVPRLFGLDPNGLIYDPNFRVLDQTSYGVYGGVEYPLSKFSALRLRLEGGRDEIDFDDATGPDGRNQPDIATEFFSAAVGYRYSNTVYAGYGPLDGQSLLLEYSVPLRPRGRERETYALIGDYRLHHWLGGDTVLALRAFAGGVGGADALDYPFRLGGYGNLRAYDFQSISGRYAFFTNIELRFPLIRALVFALPVDWSPGWIRGVLFADGGGAFDDPAFWQGYESRTGRTRDLRLAYGAGLHFPNLLAFVLPGSVLKIEWGTPYDLKTALPPRLWRGTFSVGVSF